MNDDLSLRVILRIFLILEHFEPRYSYKKYSYIKQATLEVGLAEIN